MNTFNNGNFSVGPIGNDYSGSMSVQSSLVADLVVSGFAFAGVSVVIEAARYAKRSLKRALSITPSGQLLVWPDDDPSKKEQKKAA